MNYKIKKYEEVFPEKEDLPKKVINKLKDKNLFWMWFWTIFPIILFVILSPKLNPQDSYLDYIFGIGVIVIVYTNGRDLYRYYKYIKPKLKKLL